MVVDGGVGVIAVTGSIPTFMQRKFVHSLSDSSEEQSHDSYENIEKFCFPLAKE